MGGLGPTVSAFLSIGIAKGDTEFKEYNRRLFKWRLNAFWFMIPFAITFGIAITSFGLNKLVSNSFNPALRQWYMIFPLFVVMILGGGLEELGWRGIALPELEKELSPLISSLILGIIWFLWHLPLFFINGTNQYGCSLLIFFLGVMGNTFILTWIYNKTESVLICVVFHASSNMVASIGLTTTLVPPGEITRGLINASLIIILGLILLLVYPEGNRLRKSNDAQVIQ